MVERLIRMLSIIALVVVALASSIWIANQSMMPGAVELNKHEYAQNLVIPSEGQTVKEFNVIAKESMLELRKGLYTPVLTYGGSVPGTEIRVTQGDFVRVLLKNELHEAITIHWHGYPVKSSMDGIPGLDQDAVSPGETFTYEFSADVAGTYWYHSHQKSAEQVDKGLYGALIVEPEDKRKPDKDLSFIFDEWMENTDSGMGAMSGMGEVSDLQDEKMMSQQYNIYTVNGKSGDLIQPVSLKKGEVVRLRFINAGYRTHGIHIPGQDFKVVSSDGQDINGASLIKDEVLMVAPGERYDVEFTVSTQRDFTIDAHDNNKFNAQLRIPVYVEGSNGQVVPDSENAVQKVFSLEEYGVPGDSEFTLGQTYDVDKKAVLGTRVDGSVLKYTIDGQTYSDQMKIMVKTGDRVKLTYENQSQVDHPMHLHGHFFQILSKNGKSVSGATLLKDTVLVKPGEVYVIAFKADNTGKWVQHCHELHHASAGMMQEIIYTDYVPIYIPDPKNTLNKPE